MGPTLSIDETHDPLARSRVPAANDESTPFPLQNLPLGVCTRSGSPFIGTAIGDKVLNVTALGERGQISAPRGATDLLPFMKLLPAERRALRHALFELLREGSDRAIDDLLLPLDDVALTLPAEVGDYTDFYASREHATHVGALFRPDSPLLPNYLHVPIAYHGRASSVTVSPVEVRRPCGQFRPPDRDVPIFGASTQLDFELELGLFIARGNELGQPIPLDYAREHMFGFVLLNDWSARDIQSWEYQPLGPFLGKNFCTTISPWVVTLEALAPFFIERAVREAADPPLLPYLAEPTSHAISRLKVDLEVRLSSAAMRDADMPAAVLTRSSAEHLYWSFEQMLAHHTVNGCNLRAGDLLGSGTISGEEKHSRGCLLEQTERGRAPLSLPDGSSRLFLEDGDEITLTATCARVGFRSIGFGEARGTVLPALRRSLPG